MIESEQRATKRIAVAIPCYNEAATIQKVVTDFKKVLPDATIIVFDNNSTDGSGTLALEAGARVHLVRKKGKGNVLQAIFEIMAADALVIVDGDDTYFAEEAPMLMKPVLNGEVDMVVGDRLKRADEQAFKQLNRFGNHMIVYTINKIFGTNYEDILSGYRVLSRRFVESVPLLTSGFEIETELTLQALEEGYEIIEMPISYRNRPADSQSKLKPFRDGWRIMLTSAMIMRDHYPLRTYGFLGAITGLIALFAGLMRLVNYSDVTHFSKSLLSGTVLLCAPLSMIFFGIGLTLSAINTRLREMKQVLRRSR